MHAKSLLPYSISLDNFHFFHHFALYIEHDNWPTNPLFTVCVTPSPPPLPNHLFLWGWLAGEFCPAANWCWCWVIMRGQTIGLDHREYWMISRGPGFLAVVWLAPNPPPPPSPVFLPQLPAELTNGQGRGRGQIIRRREILVLYKSFNTLWSGQWLKKSRPAKLYN